MRLAFAFTVYLMKYAPTAAAKDSHHLPGLRGQAHESDNERNLEEYPWDGNDDISLEITLGEASENYDGEVYSDKSDRPAENAPEHIAGIWEEVDEPGPPANPGGSGGKGTQAPFEVENGKVRAIVQYKPGTKGTILQGLGDTETHYEFDDNTIVVSIPAPALRGLQNNPNVVGLHPDVKTHLTEPKSRADDDSGRRLAQDTTYGVNMLDVKWLKKKGENIKICVLDTGYTPSHEDLPSSVAWAGVSGTPPPDYNGHGTHVAGTCCALDNDKGVLGVSPGAGVVVGPYLKQQTTYISDAVDGVEKCRDQGANIVNMSFGSFSQSDWQETKFEEFNVNDNMLLVATAGNHGDGFDNDGNAVDPTILRYPASYPSVISVAAVDSYGRRADFSAKNSEVNIAAPGVSVKSTTNSGGYASWDGTSMAAPHVSGVAARVWSIMPWLTSTELRSFLNSAAQYESLSYTGAGLVNTGFYTIMLQRSGKCLDNRNGSSPKLYTCSSFSNQMFTYEYFNKMIVGSDGKCLRSGGNSNGASVTLVTCNKDDSTQHWTYTSKQFKNGGGYCLDNHGAYQYQDNGLVHLWTCHGGTNQKWYLGKNAEARLYQHSDMYAGGQMYRTPGASMYSSMPTAIGNDRLTRVIIPTGFAFHYYQHSSYGGWNRIYGSHDFSVNLYMGGHNDAVSSFKVRKLPDGKVKLCKHSDCSSSYYWCDWVKHYSSMPSEIGNDQLTRVQIPRGYQFQYYQHSNYGGWTNTFGSCSSSINLNMGGHNDAVSSFKIHVMNC